MSAQTVTTLHSFAGTDGSFPYSGLVAGSDGNFYGTTSFGGANQTCGSGNSCGTIFEITPAGTLTTLHSFAGTDGEFPLAGLIQIPSGTFYGTTYAGGLFPANFCGGSGCGTIFSIVPGSAPITLYSFCSQANCADGSNPTSGLVLGNDGNLYGTTSELASVPCSLNCGTIFKITPVGALTTLYTFDGSAGYAPASLVQGSDGNFYGATSLGGSYLCGSSQNLPCGTLFKITPAGVLTWLYTFCQQAGCPDGSAPNGLIQASDGNFYGTTGSGGAFGYGTVFKITTAGTLTTLHSFDQTDGIEPGSGVIQGSDGNFYGTTSSGGATNNGTVFQMTPAGTLFTLYSFAGPDGAIPNALVQAPSGTFYGTTQSGGANNDGAIFSLSIAIGGTSPSTTSLTLSPASVSAGSSGPVVMTATVAPAAGSGTPLGAVAFYNGSSELGIANLTSGVATFDYNPSLLAANTYPITATYSGDGAFAASTSSAQTLTVTSLPVAATPSFSIPGGSYSSAQTVALTDTTAGATIYYTNDGTTPTTSSPVYSAPIAVGSTQTIQAIAAASGYADSIVAVATYTISSLTPDYRLSVTPPTLTIAAGQSGTVKFTVIPVNGFSAPVSFACSGLPAEATCTFSPASVTPGSNPAASTLTISTTAENAAWRGPGAFPLSLYDALWMPCLGMILGVATHRKRALRGLRMLGVFALLLWAVGLTSCASSYSKVGTPPGTSTVTVTASSSGSGAISHTATVTITVTP